ncbi:hypothetical protein B0T24DRAFT_508127, partial [Lasiosphaeria ovina]
IEAEGVDKYVPGGFHPVNIGDVIDQRYEVMHKLGYGGLSIVWLVRSCGDTPSYFALKILRADIANPNEVNMLKHLGETAGPHQNVVALLDAFKISGPNSEHHCLVFPVLGPALRNDV